MSKVYGSSFPIALGGFFCVSAGAIASAGAAGLDLMQVNNDAINFVAGCALFGVALLTIGVCLISWGVQSKLKGHHLQMDEQDLRISNLEKEFLRKDEVNALVRLHEDAEHRRQVEDRIKDAILHFEVTQRQNSSKIEIHDVEIRRLMEGKGGGTNAAVSRRLGGEPN